METPKQTPKPQKQIMCGFTIDTEIRAAISSAAAAQKTTISIFLRSVLINHLKSTGFLPADYQNAVIHGGDRLKAKLADATPEEAARIRQIYNRRAARARAAKNSKITISGNNSGIIVSGNNSAPISQKNFESPKP